MTTTLYEEFTRAVGVNSPGSPGDDHLLYEAEAEAGDREEEQEEEVRDACSSERSQWTLHTRIMLVLACSAFCACQRRRLAR